MKTSRCALL